MRNKYQLFEILFCGKALHGQAIVLAESEEEAIEMLKKEEPFFQKEGINDYEVYAKPFTKKSQIVFFWDGDY